MNTGHSDGDRSVRRSAPAGALDRWPAELGLEPVVQFTRDLSPRIDTARAPIEWRAGIEIEPYACSLTRQTSTTR